MVRVSSLYSILTITFIVLILSSITTSSLNHPFLREFQEQSTGLVAGQPNSTRGDEFSRFTPLTLSELRLGERNISPLDSASDVSKSSLQNFIEVISFAPEKSFKLIASAIPLEMGYALVTWLNVWIFSMSFVYWGRRLGLTRVYITWGLLLSVLAPSSIWWSFWPLGIVSPLLFGLALIDLSLRQWEKRKYTSIPIGLAGILQLFPYASLYFPWAFVFAMTLGIPLLVFSLSTLSLTKRNLYFVLANLAVFSSLVVVHAIFLSAQARMILATEYPGIRRFYDSPLQLGNFLDAPFSYVLQLHKATLNGSELSSSWNILILLALLLYSRNIQTTSKKLFINVSFVTIAAFALWTLIPFPELVARHIPLFPLASPNRVNAVLGISGILFVLVKLQGVLQLRKLSFMKVFSAAFFILLITGSTIRSEGQIPIIPRQIWILAAIVAAVFALALVGGKYGQVFALVFGVLFIGISSKNVLPVQVGLGELDGSVAAQLRQSNDDISISNEDAFWAADTWELPALLVANGIPVINGEQSFGPSSKWKALDPNELYFSAYNRGASTIYVNWLDGDVDAKIESPQADQIIINVGVCNSGLKDLNVRKVIATRPLTGDCLIEDLTFTWASTKRYVYMLN